MSENFPPHGSPFAPSPASFVDCGKLVKIQDTRGFAIDQFGLSAAFDARVFDMGVYQIRLRAGIPGNFGDQFRMLYIVKLYGTSSYRRVLHPNIIAVLAECSEYHRNIDDFRPHDFKIKLRSINANLHLRASAQSNTVSRKRCEKLVH